MIRSITLENFMSHGKTKIDLADGLTVLTGPNNCGKSALVAAIQILAAGGKTTHVLRHGAKQCRVTVETDDGQTVVWERKKTTVKYTINGEDIHRTGQGIPEGLHDVLKLDRVVTKVGASEESYDIHFGQQKSPVFLLDQPGSKSAAFFASSSDASRLIEMQGRHRKQLSERRAEAKRVEKELSEIAVRVAGFDPIDAIGLQIDNADVQREAIEKQTEKITQIQKSISALKDAITTRNRLQSRCRVLRALDESRVSVVELENRQTRIDRLRANLRSTREQTRTQTIYAAVCKSLDRLQPAPGLMDTRSIAGTIARITRLQRDRMTARHVVDRCHALKPLPKLQETERLDQIIRRLRTARIKRQSMKQAVELFDSLREIEVPLEVQAVKACIEKLRRLHEQKREMKRSLRVASEALDRHDEVIRTFVLANPKCTLCGGQLDPDTLMSSVPHRHDHEADSETSAESVR